MCVSVGVCVCVCGVCVVCVCVCVCGVCVVCVCVCVCGVCVCVLRKNINISQIPPLPLKHLSVITGPSPLLLDRVQETHFDL